MAFLYVLVDIFFAFLLSVNAAAAPLGSKACKEGFREAQGELRTRGQSKRKDEVCFKIFQSHRGGPGGPGLFAEFAVSSPAVSLAT